MTDDGTLFDMPSAPKPFTGNGATISEDGLYRYDLTRSWKEPPAWRRVLFVMLNPSTAGVEVNDPTIIRCRGFARDWGYDGFDVVNLYAFRATDPKVLWTVGDPVGPDNDRTILTRLDVAHRYDLPVIVAWGANAKPDRVKAFQRLATPYADRLQCLGVTKAGAPMHPLYRPASTVPTLWPEATQ